MKRLAALALALFFTGNTNAQYVTSTNTAEPVLAAKSYVRPGEPITVSFDTKKTRTTINSAPITLDPPIVESHSFSPAPATDLLDPTGLPRFQLYTLPSGEPLKPLQFKPDSAPKPDNGTLDVAAFFPQLKDPGTYLLTWQNATPLVIETLRNPLPWAALMDPAQVPPAQRPALIAQLRQGPAVITHIVPLQYAVITTDQGEIKSTFDYAAAPHTVDNFIALANDKFYDGTNFHRIIKGFMIQGGDSLGGTPDRAGGGGPGYSVPAELSDKPHARGTLSMARTNQVDSAGSQFFIIHQRTPYLDGQYTAFGQVLSGLEVVDKIAETPTLKEPDGSNNGSTNPKDRPVIKSIQILPATPDFYGIKK